MALSRECTDAIGGYFQAHGTGSRWGPSRWPERRSHPTRVSVPATRTPEPDRPAARNPDGTFKVQYEADRTPAEQRRIQQAIDYINQFA
jgi:hypothetical protein